jgi:hypothetical protein
MAKQNPIQNILNKPLSRKEFLQHVGLMFLALFGITKVMEHLLQSQNQSTHSKATGTRWGGGKFGV